MQLNQRFTKQSNLRREIIQKFLPRDYQLHERRKRKEIMPLIVAYPFLTIYTE